MKTIGSIGAGRLAQALLYRWAQAGHWISGWCDREGRGARQLRRHLGAPGASTIETIVDASEVVLIAVPDDAIATITPPDRSLRGKLILHGSGVHGPELLRAWERLGARVGVLHPLQVMPKRVEQLFPAGTVARCEGPPLVRRLARDARLQPLPERRWNKSDRADYHTAASLAGNDVVGLVRAAADLLARREGLDRQRALKALIPLTQGALDELAREGDGQAVSGPVARGDAGTLALHLERLARRAADLLPVHRALIERQIEMARRDDRIDAKTARRLRQTLRGG